MSHRGERPGAMLRHYASLAPSAREMQQRRSEAMRALKPEQSVTSASKAKTGIDITSHSLATFPRGDREQLRVSLDSRFVEDGTERTWVSIRSWERSASGEWCQAPGRGVTVRLREIGEVLLALEEALSIVKARR